MKSLFLVLSVSLVSSLSYAHRDHAMEQWCQEEQERYINNLNQTEAMWNARLRFETKKLEEAKQLGYEDVVRQQEATIREIERNLFLVLSMKQQESPLMWLNCY